MDVPAGAMVVDGIKGEARRFGPLPVRVVVNIPAATQMRPGNTRQELALSEWRPYSSPRRRKKY